MLSDFIKKKRDNYLFIFIFSCILLLNTPLRVTATHSMGADMTYECLGNNTYKIRLSFYRDCFGIGVNPFVRINISSVTCGIDTFVRLDTIPGTGQEITPICPFAVTTCNGGSFTGIQEYIYEGIFTFPAQCTDWIMSYQQCCRNQAITTIDQPLNEAIYIFSSLDNTISPCNSSPVFTNKPVPFVCMGQQFCYNHGAYDIDGDSLAYSVFTPLSWQGNPVTYFPPYSASQPLNSVPPMWLDYNTGDFCITPMSPEVTVMAILVSEYRNGVLIGQVERDIQVTVISCTNNLPYLSGINGTNYFAATVCADAPFCFDVYSYDPDAGQNVTLTWDHSIPAASLTPIGSPYPTGTFCWTPTQADVSPIPHCFTAHVEDDACPYLGSQVYSYCITVVNLSVDAGPDQSVSCSGSTTITALGVTTSGNITYQWDNGPNTYSELVGPGIYTVTVYNGLCAATDAVQVLPTTGPLAEFNSTDACEGSVVGFSDMSFVAGGGTLTSWNWNFGDGFSSIQQSPFHQYATAGIYNACLLVSSNNNCIDSVCHFVTVYPIPVVNAGADQVICPGTNIQLTANGASLYSWSNGATTAIINVAPLVNTEFIVTGTNAGGCSSSDTVEVNIGSAFIVNLNNPTICPGQTTILDAGNPGSSYLWSNGQTTQAISVSSSGNYSVTVTDAYGCTGTGQCVVASGTVLTNNSSNSAICNGQSVIIDAGNPGNNFIWSTGDSTQTINVSSPGNYSVIVTSPDGCSISFASSLIVNPLPVVLFNPLPACLGDSTVFVNNSNVSSGSIANYQWDFGDGNVSASPAPAHLYNISGSYMVTLSAVTDSGCASNSINTITVFSKPVANIQVSSNCLGDSTNLLDITVAGNDTMNSWNWSLGDGSVSFSQNNVHMYSQVGTYPVQMIVTSVHGCVDTVNDNVTIYPIPSADAGPDSVICSGTNLLLGNVPQAGITYQWSPSLNLDQTNTSSPLLSGINHTALPVDLKYTLIAANTFGCIQEDSVSIRILPVPVVTFVTPNPQCIEGNSFLFLPIGYIDAQSVISWNFGNDATPPSSPDNYPLPVSYSSTGNHPVSLVYSYMGCPGIPVNDTVTVLETPSSGFSPSAFDGCLPLTVTFYNSQPDIENTYTWTIQGQTLHEINPEWTFDSPGTFPVTLIVSNESGCVSAPAMVDINVFPVPVAAYTNSPDSGLIYASLIEFQNNSIGAVQYEWNFGDGTTAEFINGSHTYSDTGSFDISLIAISINGCRDTVYGKLKIVEGFSFYVPNAVTPNDDGINDNFQGYGTFLHSYEMWIYDRWGKMIYFTDDYNKPWNCRVHSLVQNDTYVYRIAVSDYNDKSHVYIGTVTVVR